MTTMPPEIASYGYVVGRAVRIIGDQNDPDELPDVLGAKGSATFTPIVKNKKISDYSAFVIFESVTCAFNDDGVLVGPTGFPGVWLVTGVYDVKFDVPGGIWGNVQIEVTSAHTQDSPLDIVQAIPYIPEPNVTVMTMLVPSGGTPGQVLARASSGSGLEWMTPSGGSSDMTAELDAFNTEMGA